MTDDCLDWLYFAFQTFAPDDFARARDELYREIKSITREDSGAEVDRLRRYVAARLTNREIGELRLRHEELKIGRVWKNNDKRALINVSSQRIQAYTGLM